MAHGHVFVLSRLTCRPGHESWVCRGAALTWRDNGPCIDDLCAWVLVTLMVWFAFRGTATPERAGMVWVVPGAYFVAGRADITYELNFFQL